MDYHQLFSSLSSKFPHLSIRENHSLAPYTTLKIGGPADIFIHTRNPKEFHDVLIFLSNNVKATTPHLQLTILGNGSNVLISDSGIRGIVIKNSGNHLTISKKNPSLVTLSSGTSLAFAISSTLNRHLTGLEYYAYIPATIGGAVYSHIHGIDHHHFSQIINSVKFINLLTGKITTQKANQLRWSYDYSQFQDHPEWIILSVNLNLTPGNPIPAKQLVRNIIAQKTITQPPNSAGCVFQNPPADSAGRIIDQELNLKNFSINGARVSDQHANFLVNDGTATARDYLDLIRYIQSQAKQKLNLDLQPEIKFLGQF